MKIEYITRNENTNFVTIRLSNPTRTYTIPNEMADDLAFQLLRAKYHKDVINSLALLMTIANAMSCQKRSKCFKIYLKSIGSYLRIFSKILQHCFHPSL